MSRGLLLWIAAPAIAAAAGWILLCGPFDWTNERVQQAGVAGLVIALGWFAGFVLRELSALLGRRERRDDVHRALRAEITHYLRTLRSADYLTAERDAMLLRVEGEEAHIPFIPRERNDTVFRAIVGDIHILPGSSVGPVVAYYSQLTALETMIEDLRGEGFKGLTPRRRGQIYSDFMELKKRALDYGQQAIALIDAFKADGPRAAERRHAAFLKQEQALSEGSDTAAETEAVHGAPDPREPVDREKPDGR